jgi:hypothetical protein
MALLLAVCNKFDALPSDGAFEVKDPSLDCVFPVRYSERFPDRWPASRMFLVNLNICGLAQHPDLLQGLLLFILSKFLLMQLYQLRTMIYLVSDMDINSLSRCASHLRQAPQASPKLRSAERQTRLTDLGVYYSYCHICV